MTPSERERRIKAALEAWHGASLPSEMPADLADQAAMEAALNAADETVPVVSEAEMRLWESLRKTGLQRDRAEAAARDFAAALREISDRKPGSTQTQVEGLIARDALGRHPSFAGGCPSDVQTADEP